MTTAAQTTFANRIVDRHRLADGLAVTVAASLPWSISASDILIVVWLIVVLSTLDPTVLRRTILLPAAAFPLALCVLAALGMLWADTPWAERLADFKVVPRLLVIGLLFMQFQRSDRGVWVLVGFLVSCTALLAFSWLQWAVPAFDWRASLGNGVSGVPVKDHIIQSGEFLLCAFALGHLSLDAWERARRWSALMLGLLALLFLANMAVVAAARSVLAIFVVFVILFSFQRFGLKGAIGVALTAAVLSSAVWASSPYLRGRVTGALKEVQDYRTKQTETSSGLRLEFWRRSIEIVSRAPIIGHGTGSLYEQFQRSAKGTAGIASIATNNPHNQTLAVAIQLGLVGVALLYAMWIAHLRLFLGSGWVAWLGCGVVVHSIGASLFSSQLFEATLGWVYIFGVGVLGGLVLRNRWADPVGI